jgi:hypothetical protein
MVKTNLPILQQRRIEANIIKPIYDEMVEEVGLEKARKILGNAVVKNSIAQAKAYADGEEKPTSLETFHALMPQWTAEGALEIEMLEEGPTKISYNVTRCKYSEMYKAMGMGEIGDLLSCNRDGTFCTGYNPGIKLERSQTIMKGASHCDFRFKWEGEPEV